MPQTTRIDELVSAYLAAHPDYPYPPSSDRHPAVLAISTPVKRWLMDRLGGPLPFWTAMLDCAQVWFPSGQDSRELRIFRTLFEADANTLWQGQPEFVGLDRQYRKWSLRQRQPAGPSGTKQKRGTRYGAAGVLTVTGDLFEREFDRYLEAAESRPVKITGHGKPATVLISVAEYGRLVRRDQEAAAREAMLHGAEAQPK